MAKEPKTNQKSCGIVMPIASMGELYPEEHWAKVQKIHRRAIEKAGLKPKLVWENPALDVIQSAILQNIYENDVIICDVSGLNPNVMLETGLRLSTKKPTIIVTDGQKKPPFDINNIGYIDYRRDLEYNSIDNFIDRLAKKIEEVQRTFSEGTYKSFVENFTFEMVEPKTETVTETKYIIDKLDNLSASISRLQRSRDQMSSDESEAISELVGSLVVKADAEKASKIEETLDEIDGVYCTISEMKNDEWDLNIYRMEYNKNPTRMIMAQVRLQIDRIMNTK
ncbi:hypothetical protein [Qipengyuania gelatinilytica]|uniref:Nucleoside 2-deoxyribosyltransferase n=1 Tax=Qipengyuania gelatinilytica TaxID=2867231 RepID=A0ABX9A8Q8_9SPHN|nr:hypothetical protein [Qipengyuania gelatinilytica]QZD95658.1 hypothetical protein K3136_02710 [Qipengyuania gelatinilytica]